MRYLLKTISTAALAGMLAACGSTGDEAMNVSGSDFNKELYQGYTTLAKSESDQTDFVDARAYSARAEATATGAPPGPEEISARKLPDEKVGELSAARNSLITALGQGAAEKLPKQAADAQLMFDCWMEQQEENFQSEDINRCRVGFETAMGQIDQAMNPPASQAAAPAAAATTAATSSPDTRKYVVYFDFNSATLNSDAQTAVSRIKGELEPGAKVTVVGFTDRAGPANYNDVLSAKRANTVYSALEQGSPKAEISTEAYGEENNAVATQDGVANQMNRRVEISVTQ